jgi:hypothetical protein
MKSMASTIFYIIIVVALFFWTANTKISFDPFSIEFKSLYRAIGLFMIMIGIGFMDYQSEKEGAEKFKQALIKELEKKVEEGKLNKIETNE